MLFKGTTTRTAEDIAQQIDSIGGQLDAFTSKEYAGYYIKVLDEHLPLAVDILADIVLQPGVRAGRHRAREEGRSSKRSRWSRTRPTISSTSCSPRVSGRTSARPADSRHAGDGRVRSSEDAARLLHRHLRRAEPRSSSAVGNLEHERCGSWSSEAFGGAADAGRRADGAAARRAADPDPQQGARAEPHLSRHASAFRSTTPIATRATC